MPKVSEEHKQARREQILVGAQRAFARHGYEGATVHRLEEETGLSRGAIFSYFENKQALFIALVRRSSDRFVEIWLEHGYRALLEAIAHEDPEWLSVQIEAARRVRTDERFREQLARLDEDVEGAARVALRAAARRDARRRADRGDRPVPRHARERRRVRAGHGRPDARPRPPDDADRDRRRAALGQPELVRIGAR